MERILETEVGLAEIISEGVQVAKISKPRQSGQLGAGSKVVSEGLAGSSAFRPRENSVGLFSPAGGPQHSGISWGRITVEPLGECSLPSDFTHLIGRQGTGYGQGGNFSHFDEHTSQKVPA
jgi:hypothetical protein